MSEALGEARIIIRPDTTLFRAQLEEQLAFAKKPIVVPVTTAATSAGGEIAGIQAVTAARTRQTAETAAAIRQTSQLERGAVRTTLSQFGLAGATLTASGAFIAAAAATLALTRTLKGSIDAAENLSIQTARLRDTAGALTATNVSKWAAGLATNFGIARDQGVQFVATLEGLFKNFGIAGNQATNMSERLVKLAADMAAFKGQGTTTTEALTALQRGLAGNARFLRTFNVFLDQSRVAQEALVETGKKQVSSLTRQELVTARYNLILADTASQTGAFKARSGELSTQITILQANVRNVEASLGAVLIPILLNDIKAINQTVDATKALGAEFKKLSEFEFGKGGTSFLGGALKDLGKALVTPIPIQIANILKGTSDAEKEVSLQSASVARDAGDAAAAIARLAEAAQHVTSPLHDATAALQGLEVAQLKIQTGLAPGGSSAELANLRQQEATQKKIIAESASGSKARREALQNLKAIQDQEKAIIAQQASDAKSAADAAKAAADAAKTARDKRDQALLDLFGVQRTKITDALISAGPKQAIAFTIKLRDLYRKQRDEARKQIKDLKTRRDELATDTTEIKTLNKQIKDLQKAQRDAIAQQAQDAANARLTHLEALLSIAETTTRTSDDRRALERIIRFDIQRIDALKKIRHRTREENAQLDALRVDLAQREQALRELKKQQDKNNNAAAELGFAFLQAQQGFAANLLGNLIPGGATGGLVGNTSTSSTPTGLRQISGGFEEPRGALSTRARIAGAPTGPSSGQASTTNELLRRILRTLEHLNTRTNHPEAARQRQTMNAAMDGVHGN